MLDYNRDTFQRFSLVVKITIYPCRHNLKVDIILLIRTLGPMKSHRTMETAILIAKFKKYFCYPAEVLEVTKIAVVTIRL